MMMRNAYRILVRKSEGKSLLGRHRHRCNYSIKIDFMKYGVRVFVGLM
jgi:hypothetical protein